MNQLVRPSVVFLLFSCFYLAQDGLAARNTNKATGAIDAATFEVLSKVRSLIEKERYETALSLLNGIKDDKKLGGYTKAQVFNLYGFIYANQEQYKKAIDMYQAILSEPEASQGLVLGTQYTLAQLYLQIEDYQKVIDFMKSWLVDSEKPTTTAYVILAQAYYQTKAYDSAITYIDKAIRFRRENDKNKPTPENWLRLKAAIYFEQEDNTNALRTYQQIMRHYPKLTYMRQISGLLDSLGKHKDRLAIYDAVYLAGGLQKEREILNLAYMYLGQGLPFKAGIVIEANMNNGLLTKTDQNMQLLANTWVQASEYKKAIPLLTKIADTSSDGLLYARLAGMYFDAGDFASAVEAASHAARRGGLRRIDSNYMLMGIALFNTEQFEAALQAFRQAKQYQQSANSARQWEAYTLAQLKRLKAIQQVEEALVKKNTQTLQVDEIKPLGTNMMLVPTQ